MRILTIDQGNTSAKAVMWEGDKETATLRTSTLSIEELLPILEEGEPEGCAYCSVGHTDAKFLETLRRLVDGNMLVLTPAVELPIDVRYSPRSSLGADRVAAAVGASVICRGAAALVVDAGTAMTLDVIDASGNFLGGDIAPGMRLRLNSLHEATHLLPVVEADGPLPPFGTDTATAIRCGVVRGMASEIAGAFLLGRTLYGCSKIVATGSDATMLIPLLQDRGLEAVFHPNLVGLGLREIFSYNLNGSGMRP